jgi:predicted dehydrogenase
MTNELMNERKTHTTDTLDRAGHRPGPPARITRRHGPFDRAFDPPPAPAGNVARLYAAFAEDLRSGSTSVPEFNYALRQHRLVEAILEADYSGRRQFPE